REYLSAVLEGRVPRASPYGPPPCVCGGRITAFVSYFGFKFCRPLRVQQKEVRANCHELLHLLFSFDRLLSWMSGNPDYRDFGDDTTPPFLLWLPVCSSDSLHSLHYFNFSYVGNCNRQVRDDLLPRPALSLEVIVLDLVLSFYELIAEI
ncbi:hypothetical protein GCK32_021540, partial [Trichostrongylus colubriformis]